MTHARSLPLVGAALWTALAVTGAAAAPQAETKPPAPKPAAPRPRSEAAPIVVRYGVHDGYDRIVLHWPAPVKAGATTRDGVATVTFDRHARIDPAQIDKVLPAALRPMRLHHDGTALTFKVPPGRRVRCTTRADLVIIDLVETGPAGDAHPAAATAKPTAETPPPETARDSRATDDAAEETLNPLPPAALVADTADHQLDVRSMPIEDGVSLRFEWHGPTRAAVFRLKDDAWIVFDRPVTLRKHPPPKGEKVPNLVQVANSSATLLRIPAEARRLVVGRAGNTWLVDLRREKPDEAERPRLGAVPDRNGFYPIGNPGAPVALADPETGEVLMAVPSGVAGAHFDDNIDHHSYHALPTSQGLLFRPEGDAVRIAVDPHGVRVGTGGASPITVEPGR